jgi:Ser-tRNA(Ala) deacylase AlaX
MTKKLFWQDPYCTSLRTHITTIHGNDITLKETIFYAFSGAQESDAGTIANKHVTLAIKNNKEIIYTLENTHGLHVDDAVFIQIDWERRYKLMRFHLAAELILELMYKYLNPIEKIGAHISPLKARIDFKWPENISTIFPIIKKEAQELIDANHEIISAFSNEENERRYWEIKGFARVPCGGTHLKRTNEIGEITLKRENRGKGQERVVIHLNK